jgi:hypothetical protein
MSRLEVSAHVCVIAVAVASLGLIAEKRFFPAKPKTFSIKRLLGKRFELPGVDWHATPLNTVLIINTHCHFCNESIPFYRRLIATTSDSRSLSVVSTEPVDAVKAHLSRYNLKIERVYQIPVPRESMLSVTPTVLVIDSGGIIRHALIGKLNSEQENSLLTGSLKLAVTPDVRPTS